jgi:hypothetical protein
VTYHNQLSHGAELQNGIAAAVGLPRELEGVVRLGETLEPNIDPWSQPEWAFLRGERLGAIPLFSAAVAAEFSIIAFGNAAGSGNLVVVDGVSFNAQTAGTVVRLEVAADTLVSGTLSGQAFAASGRDRRFGATAGRAFLRSGSDPSNTFGVALEHRSNAANEFSDFMSLPCVLKPGDDLLVIVQTVNIGVTASFKWRERKAFTGELPAG